MRLFISSAILLIFTITLSYSEVKTEIIGYKYIVPKTDSATVSSLSAKTGAKTETERYAILSTTKNDTAMDKLAVSGKANKIPIRQTVEKRPNGITATFIQEEGNIPSDLYYDSKKEAAEKRRIIIEQQKAEILEEQAVQRAVDKGLILK